jgi:anaphase-promoting complex subunit 3
MAENKHYKVVQILKDCKSEMNRYKIAVCFHKLGKYKEAEKALLGADHGKANKMYDIVPNGSYGFYLLGIAAEKQYKYA